jgi:hypothetical protein
MSLALAAHTRDDLLSVFDQVTLINFNYDRTVEQYLYWGLQRRAGVSAGDAKAALARLKIIRPYGSIGRLEWEDKAGIQFGGEEWDNDIFSISTNIRTFTEQTERTNLVQEIDLVLEAAHVVVFLGFGFHQQNLELFKPGPGKNRADISNVIATVSGVDERNFPALVDRLRNSLGFHPEPLLAPLKASQLLTDLRMSVAMAAT